MNNSNHLKLSVSQLCCERGSRTLFDGLNFQVNDGEAMIIQGSNGVGKTSLLRIIIGLSLAVKGEVCWNDQEIHSINEEFQKQLLYIGHSAAVKTELTVRENLQLLLRFWPNDKVNIVELAEIIGLRKRLSVPCSRLSAGQLRRVSLARLFISTQKLWILDEPLTALDINFIGLIEQRLQDHLKQGGLAILTTHRGIDLDQQKVIVLEI
ncbi:MAG: cytochrome c biogenesis heme-transporting ATPase CcmA [Pseudomonadota bacterium]